MADQDSRHADKAAGFLNEAACPSNTHEGRELDALRGIGWAVLAAGDRLAAVVDAADDRNTQLERIADAAEMLRREPRQWLSALAWRWRGARRLSGDDLATVLRALAEADDRHLAASDCCAECERLDPDPCGRHAAERAVADRYGELWARAERAGARCPEHSRDEALAAEYAALRARLGGDRR